MNVTASDNYENIFKPHIVPSNENCNNNQAKSQATGLPVPRMVTSGLITRPRQKANPYRESFLMAIITISH